MKQYAEEESMLTIGHTDPGIIWEELLDVPGTTVNGHQC